MPAALPPNALNDPISLMYFAYRAFTGKPDELLAERGLARVHHRILHFVGKNPGLSVNALLRILDVSKQAVNAPLRHLQEQGLIVATLARHDRRVKELRLTESGQVLLLGIGLTAVVLALVLVVASATAIQISGINTPSRSRQANRTAQPSTRIRVMPPVTSGMAARSSTAAFMSPTRAAWVRIASRAP